MLKGKFKLHKTNTKIKGYGVTEIPNLGKCMATVQYRNVTVYTSFVVVPQEVQPILGL